MLPNQYKDALVALKDRAAAVSAQLAGTNAADAKAKLADAQRRMTLHPHAVKDISAILLHSNDEALTIETLDDARLALELGEDYLAQFTS